MISIERAIGVVSASLDLSFAWALSWNCLLMRETSSALSACCLPGSVPFIMRAFYRTAMRPLIRIDTAVPESSRLFYKYFELDPVPLPGPRCTLGDTGVDGFAAVHGPG